MATFSSLVKEVAPYVPMCPDSLIELNLRSATIELCERSKAYVQDLLKNSDDGKFLIISHGVGKYGRVLGEIFVKGHESSVNQLLKENGHAYEYHGEKKKVFGS